MQTRRKFIKSAGLLGLAVAAGGVQSALFYTLIGEPASIQVTNTTIKISRLPDSASGIRICQFSDLHVGPYIRGRFIERAVEIANKHKPDVFILTGDYVSRDRRYADECAAALAGLNAPLGAYAILGNHDFWTDAEYVTSALRDAGVTVLRDDVAEVVPGLFLVGSDDWWQQWPEINGKIAALPKDGCVIIAQHNPDIATYAFVYKRPISLVLSGHTHGGQVNIPGLGAVLVPTTLGVEYAAGLFQMKHTQLYVNRGLGVVTPPVRFNCPPEIAMITLVSDDT